MKPPSGGPSTGATRAGQVRIAIALIMRSFGVPRSTTRRPTGTIIAPPMPCSTRIAMNAPSESARPHSSDAPVNTAIAAANTVRAPIRSATQPLIGISTPSVSR